MNEVSRKFAVNAQFYYCQKFTPVRALCVGVWARNPMRIQNVGGRGAFLRRRRIRIHQQEGDCWHVTRLLIRHRILDP